MSKMSDESMHIIFEKGYMQDYLRSDGVVEWRLDWNFVQDFGKDYY